MIHGERALCIFCRVIVGDTCIHSPADRERGTVEGERANDSSEAEVTPTMQQPLQGTILPQLTPK